MTTEPSTRTIGNACIGAASALLPLRDSRANNEMGRVSWDEQAPVLVADFSGRGEVREDLQAAAIFEEQAEPAKRVSRRACHNVRIPAVTPPRNRRCFRRSQSEIT